MHLEHAFVIGRNSHPEVFFEEGALKNVAKFPGKHLCQSIFLNKVARVKPAIVFKKRLWYRYFPVKFLKLLRVPFSHKTFLATAFGELGEYSSGFWIFLEHLFLRKPLEGCFWLWPLAVTKNVISKV